MNELLKFLPIALYFIVGLISLVMAFKSIFADKCLPFHEPINFSIDNKGIYIIK